MKGFGDLYKSEKKANKKSSFSKKQIINQAINFIKKEIFYKQQSIINK